MTRSIRARLLLWLLVLFTLSWLTVLVLTYLESRHEVEELFDAQLAQFAAVLSQFDLPAVASGGEILRREVYGHPYETKIAFQIWSDSRLLLRSVSAPVQAMGEAPGYSDHERDDQRWRVFGLLSQEAGAAPKRIFVGQRYDVRNELIFEVTLNALYPLTLGLPVVALLVWLGVGRGLSPLRRIAVQVAERSPNNLDPVVAGADAPQEIQPLIKALDNLFLSLKSGFERERQFTSDAAHELRTPLASLKTQSQVALRARDQGERRHALEQIIEGVDRISHLVSQLLALARLEPAAAQGEHAWLDLQQLAAEVLDELRPAASRKGIALGLRSNGRQRLHGQSGAIWILLRNLLENAVLYSPPGSRVEVGVVAGAETVELSVTDNGPGIPPAERELVFGRFYRGSGQQHLVGSGLGLSIVRRIADIHQARILLETPPEGRGLRVRIIFPQGHGLHRLDAAAG